MPSSNVRRYVAGLLDDWESGERRPRDVFAEARTSFLSGGWPKTFERDYDAGGMEVLLLLGSARDNGLDDADIPALRAYVADPDLGPARERFMAHWEAIGWESREELAARDAYYGPKLDDGVADAEATLSDPEDRRLHHLVRTDPEAAWDDLRARLCAVPPRDELLLAGLVECLMYDVPDAFIDRLETLVIECPHAREPVARAYVDGIAGTPGLDRFWVLQKQLDRRE